MEMKKSEILLESGTNELEVLEFTLDGNSYGINVAKVWDLLQYGKVQPLPRSHPYVEGIFQPRDIVYTVIDLAGYLGLGPSTDQTRDIVIVSRFNQMSVAFHVHSVEVIHRISWTQIEKPDTTAYGGEEGIVTGLAKVGNRIIAIIDFEKVVFDISPQTGLKMSEIEKLGERTRNERPILIAEDSMLLRRMLEESLHKAGYTNLFIEDNGQLAWDFLNQIRTDATQENILDKVACIITDIEMPQMDGHRLTKLIKDDPVLKLIPVVIFSSLIDESLRHKGIEVGADAQLSKPEIGNLVSLIDRLILQY